jgi:hypothetical protein
MEKGVSEGGRNTTHFPPLNYEGVKIRGNLNNGAEGVVGIHFPTLNGHPWRMSSVSSLLNVRGVGVGRFRCRHHFNDRHTRGGTS